jgi:ATP-dependent Lhr-like helicase
MDQLVADGRAFRLVRWWVAFERLPQFRAVHAESAPAGDPMPREEGIRELLRGRMEITGPTTALTLGNSLGVSAGEADAALLALETEGVVLRGRFTPASPENDNAILGPQASVLEWCDRRLLARIHRYTLNRLRAEIEPVSAADFARFLFRWQRVAPDERAQGLEGLAAVIGQLEGFEAPARSWETDLLGARCAEYDPQLLDLLCLTGRVAWSRLSVPGRAPEQAGPVSRPVRSTPMAVFLREHADLWLALGPERPVNDLPGYAGAVLEVLRARGASFFQELVHGSGLLPTQVEQGLGELAAAGLVTSDSFAGLRALLVPSSRRKPIAGATRRHRTIGFGLERAGRWSAIRAPEVADEERTGFLEQYARILLQRYGVVFHRILSRESVTVPWRDLLVILRRLEARGEIRGGRFVAGVTGEQFALPEAVATMRAVRRAPKDGQLIALSAADPLNLLGLVFPGERVPSLAGNRVIFEDGIPLAVLDGGNFRLLADVSPDRIPLIERSLARRSISPALRAVLGVSGRTAPATDMPRRAAGRRSPTPIREESQ